MDNNWVQPDTPLKPTSVVLAPLEQYAPRIWLTTVLCFPMPPSAPCPHTIYSRLRRGLSKTLIQIPLLAGQIENTADQDGKLLVRIPENDAGVGFFFKDHTITDDSSKLPTYSELKVRHFAPACLGAFGSDLLQLPTTISDGGAVFHAQANFIVGGLLLAFSVSHIVSDGEGLGIIQRTWARNTCHAPPAVTLAPIPSEKDRTRLFQGTKNATMSPVSPWRMVNLSPQNPPVLQKLPSIHPNAFTPLTNTPGAPQHPKVIWYFAPERLRELKRLASSEDTDQWISTLDALTAFIWQRLSTVRHLRSKHGHPSTKCCISMNIRARLQPPLHPDFFGNAVDITFAEYPTEELENSNLDLLPKIAGRIRSVIKSWTEDDLRAFIGTVDSLPPGKTMSIYPVTPDTPNMLLTDTSKTKAYTLDWGRGLGFIDSFRLPVMHPSLAANLFITLPMLPNGGMEIASLHEAHVTEALKKDVIFTRFAEFRG